MTIELPPLPPNASEEAMHSVTIIVPEMLMDKANHMAAILGESIADIATFSVVSWRDNAGETFAVASALVSDGFLRGLKELPPTPPEIVGVVDMDKAFAALSMLGQPSGLMIVIGDTGLNTCSELGLARIVS